MVVMKRHQSTGSSFLSAYNPIKAGRSMFGDDAENTRGHSFNTFDSGRSLKTNMKKITLANILRCAQYLIFALGLYYCYSAHSSLGIEVAALTKATDDYNSLYDTFVLKEKDLQKTHDDFTHLNLQLNALAPAAKNEHNVDVRTSEERLRVTNTFLGRRDAQNERMLSLKKAIQESDKIALMNKYGPGPFGIEVCVIVDGKRKFFTIETAPEHIAPHAILAFMNMVHSKSWDNTVLYHQVDHVVVGVPVSIQGVRKTTDELQPLLFSEYSEEFLHTKNTVGFQGKPGGPEFYINLDDNSEIHSPGGQDGDEIFEGESCFGKITHGIDVAKEFQALNQKAKESDNGVYYSVIESMRIVRLRY